LYCILIFGVVELSFAKKYGAIAPISSTPTQDTTITACGTSTTLNTSTVTGYSNPSWNNGSTGTSLVVTSSGDYWWQVIGSNIVNNGTFEAPTTTTTTRGFTSSYIFKDAVNAASPNNTCSGCCCGLLSVEGTYGINTNPRNLHSNFSVFGDHTSGTGNMLVVNGAATANVTVWTQNITVTPNTNYVFSAWATSVYATNPAILQFSINGSPLGGTINISSSLANGVWQYFTTTWNSGSLSGAVPIALVNQNTATNGNDFAVDDIVFAPVFRQNMHVTLNPIPVLTLTSPHEVCGSYDLTKAIVGYDTGTYNYFFKNSSGTTITAANATAITQSGTYTITEQNKTTGCQSLAKQTTITIDPNPQKPGITSL
jgi:hypothetical protein